MKRIASNVIAIIGGPKLVAEICGVDISRVHRWTYPKERGGTDGSIPNKHVQPLLEFARAKKLPLTLDHFFNENAAMPEGPPETEQAEGRTHAGLPPLSADLLSTLGDLPSPQAFAFFEGAWLHVPDGLVQPGKYPLTFAQVVNGRWEEIPAAPAPEAADDDTAPTALDAIVRHLVKAGLLPAEAEGHAPRTFCKVPGQIWRFLRDTESPPMDARIIRTEWNGEEWKPTFDSHEPVQSSEEAA